MFYHLLLDFLYWIKPALSHREAQFAGCPGAVRLHGGLLIGILQLGWWFSRLTQQLRLKISLHHRPAGHRPAETLDQLLLAQQLICFVPK